MTRKLSLASSAAVVIALLGYLYADSLVFLFGQWGSEDYSHGMFVPLISLFLIWQARHRIAEAGGKIVGHHHTVAAGKQVFHHMRADVTGAASD